MEDATLKTPVMDHDGGLSDAAKGHVGGEMGESIRHGCGGMEASVAPIEEEEIAAAMLVDSSCGTRIAHNLYESNGCRLFILDCERL